MSKLGKDVKDFEVSSVLSAPVSYTSEEIQTAAFSPEELARIYALHLGESVGFPNGIVVKRTA